MDKNYTYDYLLVGVIIGFFLGVIFAALVSTGIHQERQEEFNRTITQCQAITENIGKQLNQLKHDNLYLGYRLQEVSVCEKVLEGDIKINETKNVSGKALIETLFEHNLVVENVE